MKVSGEIVGCSYLQPSQLRDPGNNLVVWVNDLASYPGEKRQNNWLKKTKRKQCSQILQSTTGEG